jgi:hypothetical protein
VDEPIDNIADFVSEAKARRQYERHASDGPLPLFPPIPPSEPFPVVALGPALSERAKAIAASVQVPTVMAAQSVLATASLAACGHADVMLPYGIPIEWRA